MEDVRGCEGLGADSRGVLTGSQALLSGLKGAGEEASFPEADSFVCLHSQAKRRSNYEEGKA